MADKPSYVKLDEVESAAGAHEDRPPAGERCGLHPHTEPHRHCDVCGEARFEDIEHECPPAFAVGAGEPPVEVPLPRYYYQGVHGDPIAVFDRLGLLLHPDGSVTWKRASTGFQ